MNSKTKKGKKSINESTIESAQTEDEMDITAFVGLQIRERRRFLGMTISELNHACGISISNLSKIETGVVSPSLQSLNAISQALNLPIHSLFKGYDDEGSLFHVPNGKGMIMARPGKSGGHTYELLANNSGQVAAFTPYLVTLEEQSKQRATFTHSGTEFLYMLKGSMEYRYGTRIIDVKPGDTLIFDGRTPHGPEKITKSPAKFLAVLSKSPDNGTEKESED